jgi:hypothetical protein
MDNAHQLEASASRVGDHEVASLKITEDDRRTGRIDPQRLAEAKRLFSSQGYLRVEDLFTPDQMRAFDRQYRSKNASLLAATNKADSRPLFTLQIEGAFADAQVLDNPLLRPLLSHFLGEDFIVAAVSAVASFPGAPDQFLHRDAEQLFSEDNEIDKDLPVTTITMLAPLIDFTHETGCTRVWPGSHRIAGTEAGLAVGSLDPELRVGSVLLTDGRVLHRGAANRSNRVRPLFYLTFHRSWFRDFGGYTERPPILVSDRELARLDPGARARLAWSRDPYAGTRLKYPVKRRLPPWLRLRISRDL